MTSREMHFLRALLDGPHGTGSDRQIAAYQQRGNVQDVIHLLLEETLRGVEATVPRAFCEAETEPRLAAIKPLKRTGKDTFHEAETEAKLRAIQPLRRLRSSEPEQI